MTKKFIIITAIILLMSVVGCVAAYATIYEKDIENVAVEPEVIPEDDTFNVPEEFEYVLSNGKKLNLKLYNEEDTLYDGKRYVYLDQSNKEYWFDKDGDLTAVTYDLSWADRIYDYEMNPLKENEWIDVKSADEIARKHTTDVYGNALEGYELFSSNRDYHCLYFLVYRKMVGEDKSITGSYAYIYVLHNGKVLQSSIHHEKVLNRIDIDAVNKLTSKDITEIATKQAKAIYADDYIGITIDETVVIPNGDRNMLMICCVVDIKTELGDIGGASETFYYPIS